MLKQKCDSEIVWVGTISPPDTIAIVLNSIQVDNIVYTAVTPILLNDAVAINVFLMNNNLLNILFTYFPVTGYKFSVTQSLSTFQNIIITNDYGGVNPTGVTQNFSAKNNCKWVEVNRRGCTDPKALNYDPLADEENDSCQYRPVTDFEIIECCLGQQAYELAMMDKYSIQKKKSITCRTKSLYHKQRRFYYITQYRAEGTVIKEAIVAQDEILATAAVLFDFLNDSGWVQITMKINGVVIATIGPTYYSNIPSLAAALYAAMTTAYAVSLLSNLMNFTAPVGTGAAGNWYPVVVTGTQVYFEVIDAILTAAIECNYGCYDYTRAQVFFGSESAHRVLVFKNGITITVIDVTDPAGEVIYNPITDRKYVALTTGRIAIIEVVASVNQELLPKLTANGTGTYFACYNGTNTKMYFSNTLGTDQAAGLTGSITVYDGTAIPEIKIADIPMPANTFPRGITYHKGTGKVYIVGDGDFAGGGFGCTLSVIDNSDTIIANAVITIPRPVYAIIVRNPATNFDECWVCGGDGKIEIFDAINLGASIQTITLSTAVDIVCIKQSARSGYVYVTTSNVGTSGFGVIRISDRVEIKPIENINYTLLGIVEDQSNGDIYMAAPLSTIGGQPAVLVIRQVNDIGLPVSPDIPAQCAYDFSFLNSYGWFTLVFKINNVLITNLGPGYWNSITSFVSDLQDAIAILVLNPAYFTYDNGVKLYIISPPGLGTSQNGKIVLAQVSQKYFFTLMPHVDVAAIPCTFGCYDPILNHIVFGTYTAQKIVVIQGGVKIDEVATGYIGGEAVYNSDTGRKYMGAYSNDKISVIEWNGTNYGLLGYLNSENGCYFGCFNPVNKKLYYTNRTGTDQAAGLTGSLSAYIPTVPCVPGVIDEVLQAYYPLPANSFPASIRPHPNGKMFIACNATPNTGFIVFDINTNTFSALIPTTGLAGNYAGEIIANGVNYEYWIGGSSTEIQIYDATAPYGLLDTVPLPTNFGSVFCIRQHSVNGYVYVTSGTRGGFCVIDVAARQVLTDPNGFLAITGASYGLVENTNSKIMYMANPSYSSGDPEDVVMLDYVDQDIEHEEVLSGGQNEVTVTIPPVSINESFPFTGGEYGIDESEVSDAIVVTAADNCGITEEEQAARVNQMVEDCRKCCDDTPPDETEEEEDPDDPTALGCLLDDMDVGMIHCSTIYITCVDGTGNMNYLNYWYKYEYSVDAVNWTEFGDHFSFQDITIIPGFDTQFWKFRITIKCTEDSVENRVVVINQDSGFPFNRFLYTIVNGVKRLVKLYLNGINYFADSDTIEFIQYNTMFDTAVLGPVNWSGNDHVFQPGELLAGTYNASFTDISGGINNGCSGSKQFLVEIMATPVITGASSKCFVDSSVKLTATSGYDTYKWYKDGVLLVETSSSLSVTESGDYTVTVENYSYPGLILTSLPFNFVCQPELPAIAVTTSGACVTEVGANHYELVVGNVFNLVATPGFQLYDFGSGTQASNIFPENSGGTFNVIGYINGCPTEPIVIQVDSLDSDIEYTITEITPAPNLSVQIEITDARVTTTTLSITCEPTAPPAAPQVFNNTKSFVYTPPVGTTNFTMYLSSSETDPDTGCNLALFATYGP